MPSFIRSARKNRIKRQGVVIRTEKELSKSMTVYEQTSRRIICVNHDTNVRPASIIQVYVPGSNYVNDEIENFYYIIQQKPDTNPIKSTILMAQLVLTLTNQCQV